MNHYTPKKYSISITSYKDKSLVSIIIKQQHEDMAQLLNIRMLYKQTV